MHRVRFTSSMRKLGLIAAILAAYAVGQDQTVRQEGQYWVRSGSTKPAQLAPQVKRLEIFTQANVTVRGSEDGNVQIKLRQRVRAASAENANRMWGTGTQLGPFVALGNLLRLELYPV